MATFELSFGGLDQFDISHYDNLTGETKPRSVTSGFELLLEDFSALFFLLSDNSSFEYVCFNSKKALTTQLKALRSPKEWLLFGMRRPKLAVIRGAEQFIKFVPSDFLLEGFVVSNYGNGTVAMYKHGVSRDISINIGATSFSYVVLDRINNKILQSGQSNIDCDSLKQVFSLF